VYAALRTDHAGLGFVVRGDIATPSMVLARSSQRARRPRAMPPLALTDEELNSLATLAARRRPARNEVIE
jgi:hypothetical protein